MTDPTLDALQLHPEEYVFVGAPPLLKRKPLRRPEDASEHTLLDAGPDLPLFGYWRDAPGGGDRLHFGKVLRLGTIAAIRQLVLEDKGVAVLPRYLVKQDLGKGRLRRIFPDVTANHDHFRLVFRRDDPRRPVYDALAGTLRRQPLT
jgi:DNA-binding transcriptional LysR family regulator